MADKRLAVFGEILFDHFPCGERVLGGAPFNVAWHLRAFGQIPILVSRVGADEQGQDARAAMRDWDMDTQALQTDPGLPTGRVDVQFENDEPHYDIFHPAAFDAISHTGSACRFSTPIDLLYHGTLALRHETSRFGLDALRQYEPGLVFIDVNLRAPWWQRRDVLEWVGLADWVKMNTHEMEQLGYHGNTHADLRAQFLADHGLKGLVLTDGARGAELLTAAGARFCVKPEPGITIIDTVGAGDALASVIILGLLEQWPPETALQRAQAFASAICGQRGATVRERNFYRQIMADWQKS
jgi:fructokinase